MQSSRLGLPYIAPAQAKKHVTVNEAFRRLDALTHINLLDIAANTPPAAPLEGDSYGIGDTPSAEWQYNSGDIAVFQDGAWSFITPQLGWIAWHSAIEEMVVFDGSNWNVTQPAPTDFPAEKPSFGINTGADNYNRLSVKSDGILFSHDDQTPGSGDVNIAINRVSENHKASLVFQNNYAAKLELGLLNNDEFQMRLHDTSGQTNAVMSVNSQSGTVAFAQSLWNPRRTENKGVTAAGGTDWWGPADPLTLNYSQSNIVHLVANQLFSIAIFVPNPIKFLGAFACQNNAASTGAVLRAGLFKIGQASGDKWQMGQTIADLGIQNADSVGIKYFDLAEPITLQPGWYLLGIGCNSSGAQMRYCRWFTPGLSRFIPIDSPTNPKILMGGIGKSINISGLGDEIANGLPNQLTRLAYCAGNTNGWARVAIIPKWRAV